MSIHNRITHSYNNLRRFHSIYDQIQLDENPEEFMTYFDYYEEYDNKEYETEPYKQNYCGIERTYTNVLLIARVGQLNGVEYIIAKEKFSKIELAELKNFCPCFNCYKQEICVPDIFKIYFKSNAHCLKNGIKAEPLIQEARKLKKLQSSHICS